MNSAREKIEEKIGSARVKLEGGMYTAKEKVQASMWKLRDLYDQQPLVAGVVGIALGAVIAAIIPALIWMCLLSWFSPLEIAMRAPFFTAETERFARQECFTAETQRSFDSLVKQPTSLRMRATFDSLSAALR